VFQLQDPPDYRDSPVSGPEDRDRDRVELIKLPAHSNNGTIPLNIPSFATSTPETEAPLNLSLKPQQSSAGSSSSAQQSSLSSLSSLSASVGTPGVSERTCKSSMFDVFFLTQGRTCRVKMAASRDIAQCVLVLLQWDYMTLYPRRPSSSYCCCSNLKYEPVGRIVVAVPGARHLLVI
jgi:hypothetical protein